MEKIGEGKYEVACPFLDLQSYYSRRQSVVVLSYGRLVR